MTPEAQLYLEEGLRHVRQVRAQGPDDDKVRLAVARFVGAVEAMQVAGLLTNEEHIDWMHLVDATADGRGGRLDTSPNFPGVHTSLGGQHHLMGTAPGSPPPAPPPPPPPIPKFIRMVPGPNGEVEFYGGRLSIMGVELFDAYANIRWRLSPPPDRGAVPGETSPVEVDMAGLPDEERARLRRAPRAGRFPWLASRFAVTDDVGTVYDSGGGSWSATGDVETGDIGLRPAPPPEATELIIDAIGVIIRVPLSRS